LLLHLHTEGSVESVVVGAIGKNSEKIREFFISKVNTLGGKYKPFAIHSAFSI